MSRSSKGFADFFPTAPSVLQQKRSKAAQSRRRTKSPTLEERKSADASSLTSGPSHRQTEGPILTDGSQHGNAHSALTSAVQDEGDCAPGDMLNGVGSASSTSTGSSIFSTSHHASNMAHPNGTYNSTSLTPMTNADSSPQSNTFESPQNQRIREKGIFDRKQTRSPSHYKVTETLASSSRQQSAQPLCRTQARPGSGEVKGLKATYDPDLDKKLTSKERKSRQVQYEEFGIEVRLYTGVFINRLYCAIFLT